MPGGVSRWSILVVVLLVVGAIAMITVSLRRPQPPEFTVTPEAVAEPDGAFRLTVDAGDAAAWRFVSLATGTVVAGAEAWDLGLRRFHIISNGGPGFAGLGGVADIGDVPLDSAGLPAAAAAFQQTVVRRDSVNAAIERWYRYGFTSHLLTPLARTYIVRGADGVRHYAVRVVSYYCTGARAGCVTIRYRPL